MATVALAAKTINEKPDLVSVRLQSRTLVSVLTIAVLLFSGCAGRSADKESSASPTFATEATVTADSGGIEGRVTDDELQPIAGADVGLIRTTVPPVKTDKNGAFAFSELTTGTYDLVVQALGFKELALKIDVIAGEVARPNISLKAQPVEEPVNALTAARNTLFLHANYGPPNTYWVNTIVGQDKDHQPPHNRDCVGYNSLGFVLGAQTSEWTVPLAPELPSNVALDTSKPLYVRLFLCPFNGDETTGSVTMSFTLSNGEKTLAEGEGKTVNLAGPNAIKVEWEVLVKEATIVAESGMVWDITAQGYYVAGLGLGACQKCESQSSLMFPVV